MSTPINMPPTHGDASLKCGTCQWFVQGFEGKTCQVVRQVEFDTRACTEYQMFRKSPFAVIEKDKFLIEMRKTMMVWTKDTIDKYDKEIRGYKILSKETQLKDPMAYIEEDKLAELAMKFEVCQAMSERLLDIRYNIMDKCDELQSFAKDVQAYLLNQYRDHVQSLKNESERGAFFRASAPELFRALDKMQLLQGKVELAQDNLKSTHFALSRKQDAVLELWKSRISSAATKVRSGG